MRSDSLLDSGSENLDNENNSMTKNNKLLKNVAALHGDGSKMFDDYHGEDK